MSDQELRSVWVELGMVGAQALYQAARNRGLQRQGRPVTLNQVRTWHRGQAVAQVFRPVPRAKGKIPALTKLSRVGADLISFALSRTIMEEKANGGFSVILVVVDYWSRKAWARACLDKRPSTVAVQMAAVLDEMGGTPGVAIMDGGAEWSGDFAQLLRNRGISQETVDTGNHNAMGVVDAVVSQLKKRIWRGYASRRNRVWLPFLWYYVRGYNQTPHTALRGETPEFTWSQASEGHTLERIKEESAKLAVNAKNDRGNRLQVGDYFRVHKRQDDRLRRAYKPRVADGTVYRVQSLTPHYVEANTGDRFPRKQVFEVPPGSLNVPLQEIP